MVVVEGDGQAQQVAVVAHGLGHVGGANHGMEDPVDRADHPALPSTLHSSRRPSASAAWHIVSPWTSRRPPRRSGAILALDTGTSKLEQSMLTYTWASAQTVRIPRVMWVLQGPTTMVVDTSVRRHGVATSSSARTSAPSRPGARQRAARCRRRSEGRRARHPDPPPLGPRRQLRPVPGARVLVQQYELRYASARPVLPASRSCRLSAAGACRRTSLPNLETVDGEVELAPGLRVVPAPGHTPGSQAVIVDTAHGPLLHRGRRRSARTPTSSRTSRPGFHVNVDDAVDSMDRLRATADHFLPGARLRGLHRRPRDGESGGPTPRARHRGLRSFRE